jgi:hypothetical protein
MESRDRFPNMGGPGVETFMFNTQGYEVGKIRRENFEQMWTLIRNAVFAGKRLQFPSLERWALNFLNFLNFFRWRNSSDVRLDPCQERTFCAPWW